MKFILPSRDEGWVSSFFVGIVYEESHVIDMSCASWRNVALYALIKRKGKNMAFTKRSISELAFTTGMAMSLLACNGNGDPTNSESNTRPALTADNKVQEVVKEKMNVQDQIAYSMTDLTARLDVGPAEVTLSGVTPVTWRSGALGCPEPGMN